MTARERLYNILSQLGWQIFNVGENYIYSDEPYIVLKKNDSSITANSKGRLETFDILCYVPDASIELLDKMCDAVEEHLVTVSDIYNIENVRGVDYHDEHINMYMSYIRLQFPVARRCC